MTGTGWLGYARADVREGSRVEGAGVNAGLRYQFSPESPSAISTAKIFQKAPAAARTTYNWTGLYVGGMTGATHETSDWTLLQSGSGIKQKAGGLLGGFEAGYNVQISSLVWGIEGDFAWTNARANRTGPGATTGAAVTSNPPNTFPFGLPPSPFAYGTTPTCTSRIDLSCQESAHWIATLAGRLGYASDRMLVFVKGGGAWMNGTAEILDTYPLVSNVATIGPVCFCVLAQSSDRRAGFLIGAGFEYAYTNNLSVKAEYNFLDFGARTLTFSDGERWSIKHQFSQMKLGLNYRPTQNWFGP